MTLERELPEYLRLLADRYPTFSNDARIIGTIGVKVNGYHSDDDHTNVCVNQCRVAWEMLNSIHCVVAYDYGLAAASLCRNLFELVTGTIFLIENPVKLRDFVDYGKVVAYEVIESTPGADPQYLQAFKTKADYDNLKKRFGRDKWHGKSIKILADDCGMKILYDSFYKEASAISHGDSFITLRYKNGAWELTRDIHSWSSYCEMALDFSFTAMGTLYHRAVYKLKLPFLNDVQAVLGRLKQKGLLK
ncbi:MAG: DUF5677 domain-containing protein [Candidatus Acidiferrum sp.]